MRQFYLFGHSFPSSFFPPRTSLYPLDVSRRRCFQLAAVQRISSPSARESPRKAAISSVSLVTKPPGLCSGLLRSPCSCFMEDIRSQPRHTQAIDWMKN
nr:uncharacterized protein LOC105483976 isoform X5 [Macaca nemestrina]